MQIPYVIGPASAAVIELRASKAIAAVAITTALFATVLAEGKVL
jgi:hypothetical protein